jgi:lauroyl/myristoyl acyltransferase
MTEPVTERPAERPARLIDARDLANAALFAGLAPAAWLMPEAAWPSIARASSWLHIAARGSAADDLRRRPALERIGISPRALEQQVLAGNYLETLQMLREHRPGGWRGSIRLVGSDHIASALARGNGAVLWLASVNFAELLSKKALHAAGFAVTNLRSFEHPYSSTRFGLAVLNRLRTRVEDRHLAGTVTLRPDNAPVAMRELLGRLRANGLVSITASSAGQNPLRLPFFDGTLNLALGGSTLASLAAAPLLPVFVSTTPDGAYRVEIQAALAAEVETAGRNRAEKLAAAFAQRLEAFVRRHPEAWRGWFNRYQWQPSGTDDATTPLASASTDQAAERSSSRSN